MMVMKDEVSMFNALFIPMVDTYNKEYKLVTLLDIKENLKENSLSQLRSLTSVLINSLNDLSQDKENLKESLEKYDDEVIKISVQVAELPNEKGRLENWQCEEEIVEFRCKWMSINIFVKLLPAKII